MVGGYYQYPKHFPLFRIFQQFLVRAYIFLNFLCCQNAERMRLIVKRIVQLLRRFYVSM